MLTKIYSELEAVRYLHEMEMFDSISEVMYRLMTFCQTIRPPDDLSQLYVLVYIPMAKADRSAAWADETASDRILVGRDTCIL